MQSSFYGRIDSLIKTEGSSDNCLAQPSYLKSPQPFFPESRLSRTRDEAREGRRRAGDRGAGLGIAPTWALLSVIRHWWRLTAGSGSIGRNSWPLPFGAHGSLFYFEALHQCFAKSSSSVSPETSSALVSAHSVRVSLLIWKSDFRI